MIRKIKEGDKVTLFYDPSKVYDVLKVEKKMITVYRSDKVNYVYKKVNPKLIKEIIE